jgi:hypothetical protein
VPRLEGRAHLAGTVEANDITPPSGPLEIAVETVPNPPATSRQ